MWIIDMWITEKISHKWKMCLAAVTLLALPVQSLAQDNAFAPGWILNSDVSALRFQSVKNSVKVESSSFASYTGTIDKTGLATIRVKLDSVDTKIDLRNVRMRFLFFETFQFPEAVITMQITPEILENLGKVRRKIISVPYTIDLHGISRGRTAEIAITLLDDDTVLVTSSTPISLPTKDFGLDGGIKKLEEAAKVIIIPSATVTFDFTFNRSTSAEEFKTAVTSPDVTVKPSAVAMETAGDFSLEACKGRFEIMSRADNIYFPSGSSRLEKRSAPLLDSISEIINRCPDLAIQVAGHTDSVGDAQSNQALSERRATSVVDYLVKTGIDKNRIKAVGFGEENPVVPNDTTENKRQNRRIEFSVTDG